MTFKECKISIWADLNRMTKAGFFEGFKYLLFNASFKITFWFRIGCYLKSKRNIFSKVLYAFVFMIYKHCQFKTGIQMPIGTNVGNGLCFPHFSCIVIFDECIIGKNCTVFQGVTIGAKRGRNGGSPQIGDNVVISPGSKIIGKITIGNNVMIGANSVVVKDVPDNVVVAGNPAKVISDEGIYYVGLQLGIEE
jgi:serine O-acetyltransferase